MVTGGAYLEYSGGVSMRSMILMCLLFVSVSVAQTPFEFGVVQDLIAGQPFVSVISIKISHGSPVSGCTMLEMAARGGLVFEGKSNSFLPDSLTPGSVRFSGQILYDGIVPVSSVERIFSVISSNMRRFPGTRITHIALDLISVDDMSWISIRCPVERMDSLLAGNLDHLQFWRRTDIWELEIGTCGMPVTADAPTIIEQTLQVSDIQQPLREPAYQAV